MVIRRIMVGFLLAVEETTSTTLIPIIVATRVMWVLITPIIIIYRIPPGVAVAEPLRVSEIFIPEP